MEDLRDISKLKRGPKPESVAFMEGKEVQRLMRKYKVTIRDLSQRMGVTQKRIRRRREIGLEGRELIRDWVQGIIGADPGRSSLVTQDRLRVIAAAVAGKRRRIEVLNEDLDTAKRNLSTFAR